MAEYYDERPPITSDPTDLLEVGTTPTLITEERAKLEGAEKLSETTLSPMIDLDKQEIQAVGDPIGKAGITSMDQVPSDDGTGYFKCSYRVGNPTDIGCSKTDRAGLEELINSPGHVVFDVVRLSEWEARKD